MSEPEQNDHDSRRRAEGIAAYASQFGIPEEQTASPGHPAHDLPASPPAPLYWSALN